MPTRPLTEEQCQEVADAWVRHRKSRSAAAAELGMPLSRFRDRLGVAARRGMLDYQPVMPGYEVAGVSSIVGPDGAIKRQTVHQRPERHAGRPVPAGHVVKGVSSLLDAAGRTVQQWVKTREDRSQDYAAAIRESLKEFQGLAPSVDPPSSVDSDLLTVYPIADQHLGMMAWGDETGESYDLKIGAARLTETATDLVAQSPRSGTALILNLGDYYHADDQTNATPASGHRLDVDGRYPKVMRAGVDLMMRIVGLALQRHGRVIVRNLPGNHDPHASVGLSIALDLFYSRSDRVSVDLSPSEWHFQRFGDVLLGAHHGHRTTAEQMVMHMASACQADWGEAPYRYFYHGHFHTEKAKTVAGVVCEGFQTLAGRDSYTAAMGYSSARSLVSITHHRTRGERSRHRVNLPPVTVRAKSGGI